jgi:hypothetical protein
MEEIFCDQLCEYLTVNEDEQNIRRNIGMREGLLSHKCRILGEGKLEILIHGEYHPKLVAAQNCYLRR